MQLRGSLGFWVFFRNTYYILLFIFFWKLQKKKYIKIPEKEVEGGEREERESDPPRRRSFPPVRGSSSQPPHSPSAPHKRVDGAGLAMTAASLQLYFRPSVAALQRGSGGGRDSLRASLALSLFPTAGDNQIMVFPGEAARPGSRSPPARGSPLR